MWALLRSASEDLPRYLIGWHAEYFGVFSNNRADEIVQNFFCPGAHYLITPDLEIGVRVGWGLNEEAPNFFSNAGLGWRY